MGKLGKIVVITGRSGSGQDMFANKAVSHQELAKFELTKVVTHATRPARPGEKHGVHQYFCSTEELFMMYERGELVEYPVKTGTSHKATSKKELLKVLEGKNLVWRINLSLASEVVKGDFFDKQFPPEIAGSLKTSTLVVLIETDQETLEARRKKRDGQNYNPEEYQERDRQDLEVLEKTGQYFYCKINNPDGELEKTEQFFATTVKQFLKPGTK
jgi:guanylate kinase